MIDSPVLTLAHKSIKSSTLFAVNFCEQAPNFYLSLCIFFRQVFKNRIAGENSSKMKLVHLLTLSFGVGFIPYCLLPVACAVRRS